MEQNDHDILIALKTTVDYIAQQQAVFIERYETRHAQLVNRVTVLENQDSRDSERFRGMMEQVQRSLDNAKKIDVLSTDVTTIATEMRTLKQKSGLWDISNTIAAAVAAGLAWMLGRGP